MIRSVMKIAVCFIQAITVIWQPRKKLRVPNTRITMQ